MAIWKTHRQNLSCVDFLPVPGAATELGLFSCEEPAHTINLQHLWWVRREQEHEASISFRPTTQRCHLPHLWQLGLSCSKTQWESEYRSQRFPNRSVVNMLECFFKTAGEANTKKWPFQCIPYGCQIILLCIFLICYSQAWRTRQDGLYKSFLVLTPRASLSPACSKPEVTGHQGEIK